MIGLSIVLIIFGIVKLSLASKINWDSIYEEICNKITVTDPKFLITTAYGIILLDGLVSIACGVYIIW